jgi:hypothetical protein
LRIWSGKAANHDPLQSTPTRNDGGNHLLDSPAHNPTARIIPGFKIHADTLAHLEPMERVWAKKLIAEGTWIFVPDDEATP